MMKLNSVIMSDDVTLKELTFIVSCTIKLDVCTCYFTGRKQYFTKTEYYEVKSFTLAKERNCILHERNLQIRVTKLDSNK